MKIRVITDSAADLPLPCRPEVTVLPMTVTFGEEQFLDGVNLTHRQFYEKLIEGDVLPATSQINPAQFEEAFRQAAEAGETVVAVVVSSKLSGTFQSACIAAEEFPGRVFVVDSENATIGEQILVQRALALMDQGLDAAAVAGRLEEEKKDICLVALLDTLEYLKRGGRISSSAALVGGLLSVKPVVAVEHGEVVMLGRARGSKNGSNLLVQEIRKTRGVDFERPYLLGYTGLEDSLLQKYIADSAALWAEHTDALPVGTVGGTIGAHVGPGAVAVAFFQRSDG
ncbi:DegV family protein [Oscillibacter sp. 1-3]|uniref:DegV family protein n=1 Tax=Oscillibacter sp. 1-3 TaxID=1235797 RepID=UPI00033D9DEF|nr:DegV family protein [Oscillibacter sp. 1-3]EOS65393.1 DegV family EDD domain-containing protein [Oscillibacter sp. 1-3]MCI9512188.1 DegV family protein [Oscillibacter sp.]